MRLLAKIAVSVALLVPGTLAAQWDTGSDRHSIALFVGGATHSQRNETALAFAPRYRYRVTPVFAAGVIVETAYYDSETPVLVLGGLFIKPYGGIELMMGPGMEWIADDRRADQPARGTAADFAFRFGAGYEVEMARRFVASPELGVNLTSGATTFVYGLSFGLAF